MFASTVRRRCGQCQCTTGIPAYALPMHDASYGSANLTALSSALLERSSQIAEEMTDRIIKQVSMYGDVGLVPRADLYTSCRDNVEFVFQSLGDGHRHDLSAPRRTGRRRAVQGASLAMVQSAYRIGFAHMWDSVVAEAERSGVVSEGELVRIASDVWALNEVFTGEM